MNRKHIGTVGLYLITSLIAYPAVVAAAPGAEAPKKREEVRPLLDWQGLSHDWFGARTTLSGHGVDLEIVYTGEVAGNVTGGIERGVAYLGNLDMVLEIDMDKLVGWTGASFKLYGLLNHGDSPSELVGDVQTISNIDAPQTIKLYEAWFQQNVLDDRISILIGLYDLNSEFDSLETAGHFFHSAHGIGTNFSQAGQNGPSIFPTAGLSARLRVRPSDTSYLQVVVTEGVPGDPEDPIGNTVKLDACEGVLVAAEAGFEFVDADGQTPLGKLALGAWFMTSETQDLLKVDALGKPVQLEGNHGLYLIGEARLFEETAEQGLWMFVRLGLSEPNVNQVAYFVGAGLVYTGLFPGRDTDALGLAVAAAINGSKYLQSLPSGTSADTAEVAVEFSYRFQIMPWFAIQPVMHLVVNPGMDPSLDNALSIGARFDVAL